MDRWTDWQVQRWTDNTHRPTNLKLCMKYVSNFNSCMHYYQSHSFNSRYIWNVLGLNLNLLAFIFTDVSCFFSLLPEWLLQTDQILYVKHFILSLYKMIHKEKVYKDVLQKQNCRFSLCTVYYSLRTA